MYQLPPYEAVTAARRTAAEHLRGRPLFAEGLHHDKLVNLIKHARQIKKTKLSEEFTFEDFKATYGESARILFLIDEARKLLIRTTDDRSDPKPGQTLIALVEPVEDTNGPNDKSQAEEKLRTTR